MLRFLIIAIVVAISFPSVSSAVPPKSFNEGPYLRIIGGLISAAWDNNARTGEKTAHDYEGAYGFQFGWNLWPSTAPELAVRYATKQVRNSREHIVNIDLNIKYSFIVDGLTDLGGFHIIPFVQGGPAGLIAAVPGDSDLDRKIMGVWGLGFGGGAGVDFLIKKYISFGVILRGDMYYISPVNQTINGTSYQIITGGWEPELGIIGAAGVHF